jgi:hypothetical protein
LAEAADHALQLMHYQKPKGRPWVFDELDGLEIREKDERICEAGCYQCLLSYFNQPDHENINRRDDDARKLLIALANGAVQPKPSGKGDVQSLSAQGGDTTAGPLAEWLRALDSRDIRRPDSLNHKLQNCNAVADALYSHARVVVFLADPGPETQGYVQDRGFACIVFGWDPSGWAHSFNGLSKALGEKRA